MAGAGDGRGVSIGAEASRGTLVGVFIGTVLIGTMLVDTVDTGAAVFQADGGLSPSTDCGGEGIGAVGDGGGVVSRWTSIESIVGRSITLLLSSLRYDGFLGDILLTC